MTSEALSLFTCLSCSIAFSSAEEQRGHYKSDHHRYNMKRRIASLPPVSASVYNQKVLERRSETSNNSSPTFRCDICNKSYVAGNGYLSHLTSKKHKENEHVASSRPRPITGHHTQVDLNHQSLQETKPMIEPVPLTKLDEDEDQAIEAKIAAGHILSTTECIFCPHSSLFLSENLVHMSTAHSFFVPDSDYLTDLEGLVKYLGEKVAIGNICIYCNDKGKDFRSIYAVRKHMIDKGHCKVAYDTEQDRLEISEFYDFTSSYPAMGKQSGTEREVNVSISGEDEGWEDVEDSEDNDHSTDGRVSSDPEFAPGNEITYGDTDYELVLPSGARIGHRSMRHYYAQSFVGFREDKREDSKSGAALVRRLLADKNSVLVPRKGGFGAYGHGAEVVKAKNKGEAREAGRHVREHRDQKRKEDFKTRIGFIHNNQKHFRDPLLQ